MDYVLLSDKYQIKLASLVSNVDKDVIVELYQPLIGANATILYLTLLKQERNACAQETYLTNNLLTSMQISCDQFYSARKFLEGVGLLRSYLKNEDGERSLIYVLYAPKNPKDFFDDVLFKGLLFQYIGEKEAKALALRYKVDTFVDSSYQEISASFVDVFHPNYDDASFKKNIKEPILGHDEGRINISFNYDLFFKYLGEVSMIKEAQITSKEMKEIARLATLFGLNEKQMSFIVADEYHANLTPHLDFKNIAGRAEDEIKFQVHPVFKKQKSKVSGDDILAKKIEMMEIMPPAKFLRYLQNNTKPANADLKIVEDLATNFGFSNGVINALIDYVLTKNNNVLSRNYCEKVASSIARSGITTALDTMNYLNNIQTVKSIAPVEEKKTPAIKRNNALKRAVPVEEVSDEEISDILAKLEMKKNGGRR